MKILAIGDTADNVHILQKFSKKSKIHLINFPRKQAALKTQSGETEFFDSLLISKQVKKIKQIKNNYDLCLVVSWAAARIAYLAGINYIMFFVGGDITTPPFVKNPTLPYAKEPTHNFNFFERYFYKKVFNTSRLCITATDAYYNALKKHRKDAIRIDKVPVDTTLFNPNIKPINQSKKKFTFLSAQRIGKEKGIEKIWKAISLCKSNFEILQIEWFIEKTNEEKKFKQEILETIPTQVKLIPLIERKELGKYFMFADAILGNMRSGFPQGIERDAAYCKRPVIAYCDVNQPMVVDGEKIIPPFLPDTDNPKRIAEIIDKIVLDEKFRNELAEKEYEYIKKISDPNIVIDEWENVFSRVIKKYKIIDRKYSQKILIIENFISNLLEKFIYVRKMKQKNIEAWGKEEYEKLFS